MTHPYLTPLHSSDPAVPIALAHRGGWVLDSSGHELENSTKAFKGAVDLGYHFLETDVHATSDGTLLAFHDSTLDRATDGRGAIADLPYSEVSQAKIGGKEPIPLLADLLQEFPDARFNIDIKAPGAIEPLVDVLRDTGAWDRVCVGSFGQGRLNRARQLLNQARPSGTSPIASSCGPIDAARLRAASLAPFLRGLMRDGVICAQVPVKMNGLPIVTPGFIKTAHDLDMQVHVWTINEKDEMHRLLDAGVDGIVSDNLLGLREVLVERGQWHAPDAVQAESVAAAPAVGSAVGTANGPAVDTVAAAQPERTGSTRALPPGARTPAADFPVPLPQGPNAQPRRPQSQGGPQGPANGSRPSL